VARVDRAIGGGSWSAVENFGAGVAPAMIGIGLTSASGMWTTGASSPYAVNISSDVSCPHAAPGAPTASVIFGRYSMAVSWTARGDRGDTGIADHYDVLVNGLSMASGACEAPGTPQCVDIPTASCSYYWISVLITGTTGYTAQSNQVQGGSRCSGYTLADCDLIRMAPGSFARDWPLALAEPQPNPAQSTSLVTYSIPRTMANADLDIALFDISGRRVSTLARGVARPGRTSVEVRSGNAGALRSGVYFVRLAIGGQVLKRTLVMTR
jgi:hypothetical protein